MFRITEDPSSLVQCLAKNYKNDSILSVDMDKVGVMTSYPDILISVEFCICCRTLLHWSAHCKFIRYSCVRICCHNTDLVHVIGHDRIILVIFSQALYKAP